jgi:hypothetical protein
MSQRFGTSARKGENGFVRHQIVSSGKPRRNIRTKKACNFNVWKIRYRRFGLGGTNFRVLRSRRATHIGAVGKGALRAVPTIFLQML